MLPILLITTHVALLPVSAATILILLPIQELDNAPLAPTELLCIPNIILLLLFGLILQPVGVKPTTIISELVAGVAGVVSVTIDDPETM